jgi:hypothetical protein
MDSDSIMTGSVSTRRERQGRRARPKLAVPRVLNGPVRRLRVAQRRSRKQPSLIIWCRFRECPDWQTHLGPFSTIVERAPRQAQGPTPNFRRRTCLSRKANGTFGRTVCLIRYNRGAQDKATGSKTHWLPAESFPAQASPRAQTAVLAFVREEIDRHRCASQRRFSMSTIISSETTFQEAAT